MVRSPLFLKRGLQFFALFVAGMLHTESVWAPHVNVPYTPPVIGIPKAKAEPIKKTTGRPVELIIPSLQLRANVQDIGLLPGGKLDAPDPEKEPEKNVGWYMHGPRPGEEGSAVIDGHLDTMRGPAVFWNLKKIKPDADVYVLDDAGVLHRFRVQKAEVYDVQKAPMRHIFAMKTGVRLNLITCAGTWSKALNHYDKRLVVFAEKIDDAPPPDLLSQKIAAQELPVAM